MVGYQYQWRFVMQFLAMTKGLSIIVRLTIARVLFLIPVRFGDCLWGREHPPAIVVVAPSLSNSRFVGSALGLQSFVSSFSFHMEKEETKLYFLLKRVCTEEILLYPSASAISCNVLPV